MKKSFVIGGISLVSLILLLKSLFSKNKYPRDITDKAFD